MENNYYVKIIGHQLNIAHIIIRGSLDTSLAYAIQARFQELIHRKIYKYIVTLGDVEYISSAGIEVFQSMQQEVQPFGGNCILTNVPKKIYDLFTMTGVIMIFHIKETMEQAMLVLDPKS